MRPSVALFVIIVGISGIACSEAEFGSESGAGGATKTEEPPPVETIPPEDTTPPSKDCVEGDAINLKFPAEIQSCIDDGNIYDFERSKCSKVDKASWTCDWETLEDEMKKIGTSSSKVKGGKASGNKLVSCGQSGSGDLIVAQWWDASRSENKNCEFDAGNMLIVTGCYGDLPTNSDTENLSDEERQKVVSDCLKILSD